jgi:hypothetical protein
MAQTGGLYVYMVVTMMGTFITMLGYTLVKLTSTGRRSILGFQRIPGIALSPNRKRTAIVQFGSIERLRSTMGGRGSLAT